MLAEWVKCIILAVMIASTDAADKGIRVGCFKRSQHDETKSLSHVRNCFDYCANEFYR